MANEGVTRAVVVEAPVTSAVQHGSSLKLALQNSDGTVASTVKKQAAQADTTAADLAALKVDFNALLLKLRNAGILSSS